MSKTFFIDSENVGDSWIALLEKAAADDTILVYYTMKSPHMNYRNIILLKESDKEITFIECNYGNNALDFQLCTDLGYRAHDIGDGEFIIVSNDTGYDAVVRFWKKRGVSVNRIKGSACASVDTYEEPLDEEEVVSPEAAAAAPEVTASVPAEVITDPIIDNKEDAPEPSAEKTPSDPAHDQALEILYCVGTDNLGDLHEALKKIFGEKKGKSFYTELKSKTAYKTFLSKHKKLSREDKQKLYTSILFKANNTSLPKDFTKFVMKSWSEKPNLNSLRSALLTKYKKTAYEKYYSIIKAHIKILKNIK